MSKLTAIRILATIGMLLCLLSLSVGLTLALLGFETAPTLGLEWVGLGMWIIFGFYGKKLAERK